MLDIRFVHCQTNFIFLKKKKTQKSQIKSFHKLGFEYEGFFFLFLLNDPQCNSE